MKDEGNVYAMEKFPIQFFSGRIGELFFGQNYGELYGINPYGD